MRTEFVYSFMALGVIPVVANAAATDVVANQISTTVLQSNSGKLDPIKVTLAPGKYTLMGSLLSKVYDVKVTIDGELAQTVKADAKTTSLNVPIDLSKKTADTEITIVIESTDPGESGADFTLGAPYVNMNFDFDEAKEKLTAAANKLKGNEGIGKYTYDSTDDVKAIDKIIAKIEAIKSTYAAYSTNKLYDLDNCPIRKEDIDQLAATIAANQNKQAYDDVNADITTIKNAYNTAVADLKEALVGAAAYLLGNAETEETALYDLNDKINLEITKATSASYASYQAGTAVDDKGTNKALIPTQAQIDAVVTGWTGQATKNINAYNALHAKVTALQAALDAVKPVAAIASLFPKTEAQAAIDAVNTKVENAKNKAAQLTLNVDEDVNTAQTKIDEYKGKVDPANAEYNANEATKAAIATLQTNLNNAKTAVNAKVSKDGNYKAQDYYAAYVEGVQEEINTFTTKAAEAYKPDGTGTARSYNAALNTTSTQTKIDDYKTNAVKAVTKYDDLQTAMASYQKDLDEVRGLVEDLDIYEAEGYDYKTKLDLIQKRINDIKKAITAAQEKKGADHWTAMLAINADAAITADVKALKDSYQAAENTYDKAYLDNSLTTLSTSITTFNSGATLDKLGADFQAFADAEAVINGKVADAQTERAAIDPADEKAAEKIVALTAKVEEIKAEQTALEAAAAAVAAKVAANNTAKTTLATNIGNLQTKIGTFKTTYKIGGDDSTLGNRGKADGSVTKEVGDIKTNLGTLEGKNNAVTTTAVTKVEKAVAASGLADGVYDVEVEVVAKAAGTASVNGSEADYATGTNTYTLNNVFVSDGTMTAAVSGKEDKVTVKKLTYHENSLDATYNNSDEKNPGLNNTYTALNAQENALEKAAPGIKKAVEDNAATYTSATKDVADLQTAELNTLKSLKNVTNDNAESDDATAKMSDPANWKVFDSDLAADKTYTSKKAAIDADITAMKAALDASKAEETLTTKWQDKSISVTEKVGGKDVTTTYSISAITAAINALKNEAVAESDNWEAYKALQDNNMSKLLPDTITVSAADLGDGAVAYYQGLKNQYIADKATILANMQKSLKARTAVSTKSGFETEIAAVIAKVKVVKSDGIANKKKYDEQKAAYTETQTLWNSTYTEIAATDHSSKVQEWLDQLDAIQVDLTAATEAVEANYKVGKSVAEAKDFAAIKARINDVKAQQSESYSAQITADNAAAHESFNMAIASATAAYQTAVQERAKYSSTNAEIEEAVTTAAADLDAALYSCPTDIETLTSEENAAYAAVESPTVFEVDTYNTRAHTIEQDITTALNTFKNKVKKAINDDVWSPKKAQYSDKVATAEAAINGYSDDAKKDAFKDVKDLIAKGDAGVNEWTLSKVEEAIDALAGIDNMLAADKDKAADKDITALLQTVEEKYAEVKAYIESVTNNIPAKTQQLAILEAAYDDGVSYDENGNEDVAYAKTQAKNFNNHDGIVDILNGFITTAGDCQTKVEQAVEADDANTEAYEEMAEAITPVTEKLEEAKAAIAPYKYGTSFATDETTLEGIKRDANTYKRNGSAVAYKDALLTRVNTLSAAIETTLKNAFTAEKGNLAADITELKNQYNAYVAANGLNETATAYKAKIDDLEKQQGAIAIEDLDITEENPAGDGIQYDEILAATQALIKLQNAIADFETELLQANANAANADVLADFQAQLTELEGTASLEGYDEWVGQQTLNGKTLDEQIKALQSQIEALRAAIEAEDNIAFYKKNYQDELDAIKTALDPVAAKITALDAQFKANAAAYAALTDEFNRLQGLIDAAKAKVHEYEYYKRGYYSYEDKIEWYDNNGNLNDGVQYVLNNHKAQVEGLNGSKNAQNYDSAWITNQVETIVQGYLDDSAAKELEYQGNALFDELRWAIDNKYQARTYSSALWARLTAEKNGINNEIIALRKESIASNHSYAGSFDSPWTNYWYWYDINGTRYYYYLTLDENGYQIAKSRTSDADYAAQMEKVAAIKAEIATLSTAVDNLALLGDANEDGRVNVLDYQKVLNMILDPTLQPMYAEENPIAKTQTDEELFTNIDLNMSGVIEVGDLTAIVNYILNNQWPAGSAAVKAFGQANESLTMDITQVQQGVQRYAINLQNVEDYTAFQLDVVLPEGMTIVGSSLSERAGESHKLYSRAQMDGSVRLLASSVKGDTFSGNEGAVLYIDVQTDANFKGGSVEMLNILFSDVNAQTRAFAIGNGGEATGIDIMAAMQSLKQKVYDLGGRVMNGMRKGVNIIQNADGTTKKVLK